MCKSPNNNQAELENDEKAEKAEISTILTFTEQLCNT